MSVDDAKVQGFIKGLRTGLRFWNLWPKDAKAEVRKQVARGEEGYRDFLAFAVDQEDMLDASCKNMDEATKAAAVEAALADPELIKLLVSKASPPKSKKEVGEARRQSYLAPAPLPAPLPDLEPDIEEQLGDLPRTAALKAAASQRRVIKEGIVEVEQLWLQPVPILGRSVSNGWKPQYMVLKHNQLMIFESKPVTKADKLLGPTRTIRLQGACVADSKQERPGKCSFKLHFVAVQSNIQLAFSKANKLTFSTASMAETMDWVEAFAAAGVEDAFRGRGLRASNLNAKGADAIAVRTATAMACITSKGNDPQAITSESSALSIPSERSISPDQNVRRSRNHLRNELTGDLAQQILAELTMLRTSTFVPLQEEKEEGDDADDDDDDDDDDEPLSDLYLEALLINPDNPDEAEVTEMRKREYEMGPVKAAGGTKLLRAVWLMFLSSLIYCLYDIAMISVRCEHSAGHCVWALSEAVGTTSLALSCCMGLYTCYPPILRKFAVREMKKQHQSEAERKREFDAWNEQSWGEKYCYGSLLILPNFCLVVGSFIAWMGALILLVTDDDMLASNIWSEFFMSALVLYLLSLEPAMSQNGHKGTGGLYWAVAELRCYPQWYKSFMDRHLKYYLVPDLWGLLVLTGLNAAFIPMLVPFAIAMFPTHGETYVGSVCAIIFFVSALKIYRAAKIKYGGGPQVAMQYEPDQVPGRNKAFKQQLLVALVVGLLVLSMGVLLSHFIPALADIGDSMRLAVGEQGSGEDAPSAIFFARRKCSDQLTLLAGGRAHPQQQTGVVAVEAA